MLEEMLEQGKPHSLLLGVKPGTLTMEIGMKNSQKS